MYKWPQGKVIRMIVLILAVFVAVDLGYGALGEYWAGFTSEEESIVWFRVIKCAVYGLVALTVLIYGVRSTLFNERNAQFLIEVEQETTKVTLPSRQELVRSTAIIAIGTVIMAVVLALVDLVNLEFLQVIHSLGGTVNDVSKGTGK